MHWLGHSPTLSEEAREMIVYIFIVLRKAAKEAAVLLYALGADPYLEEMGENADRVFYFDERPRAEAKVVAKARHRSQRLRACRHVKNAECYISKK